MVGGGRTSAPLIGGVVVGALLAMFVYSPPHSNIVANLAGLRTESQCLQQEQGPPNSALQKDKVYKDVSEHWVVHQDTMPPSPPNQDATPKVVRTRFAATELGTRERLMVAVLAESALALSINATLGRHVPRVHLFADSARIDNDLALLTNLSPYKLNGQKPHSMVLGLMFNMTIHENYDWYLLVKDSTYINPFVLLRNIDTMHWNEPVLMGEPAADGSGRCRLETGVLLSNPAMQLLMQQRHTCNMLATGSDDDQLAFEKCLQLATNLTCKTEHQGLRYNVWRAAEERLSDSPAAHDSIGDWKQSPAFNRAIAVPKLLSDADAVALHDHFLRVEIERMDREITAMEAELSKIAADASIEKGEPINWPEAVPGYNKPINRYQVFTWDFFTSKDIFSNEVDRNMRPLEGKDKEDVMEVMEAARAHVEAEEDDLEFVMLKNGYRMFDPRRGMDYMIDLVYRKVDQQQQESREVETVERRVHVTRMIASTQLMNQVPYVKEDTDVTIVVPVNVESEVMPARRLLARQSRLCQAPSEESRKTRVVVAVFPEIEARSLNFINSDLEELKRRCKRSQLETDVLSVRPHVQPTTGWGTVAAAALDEAVDRYGANAIYLLLSPHADIQKEFLDRARINTIKHYQVFFPLPFVEYHPVITGMDMTEKETAETSREAAREAALAKLRDGVEPKRKQPLIVQKEHGRFDSFDFSCFSVYGVDYVTARARLGPSDRRNDLVAAFLGQDQIHILRAIEPTLRIRYHQRECDLHSVDLEDIERCVTGKKQNIASKDQLSKLLFHEKKK